MRIDVIRSILRPTETEDSVMELSSSRKASENEGGRGWGRGMQDDSECCYSFWLLLHEEDRECMMGREHAAAVVATAANIHWPC